MARNRAPLTVRVLPLASREAGRPPSGSTPAERLEMLRALSEQAWRLAGRTEGPDLRTTTSCVIRPLRTDPGA